LGNVEIISDGDTPLVYFIKASWTPDCTEFLTPDYFGQQIGMIVYSKDSAIQPHIHLPVKREVHGTTECIIVRKGRCALDIFNQHKVFIRSLDLSVGDVALLIGGGHGFRMYEDTILFEIKQGPYVGIIDKERF
jgi:hypothetical protein